MRVLSFVVAFSLITTPFYSLLAQENCGEGDSSTSVAEVLTALDTKCCGKKRNLSQRICLGGQATALKKANKWLGTDFSTDARNEVTELRASGCEDTVYDVDGKTCTQVDTDTINQTITDSCCGRVKRRDRVTCLKNAQRALNKTRKSLGAPFYNQLKSSIKSLTKAESCGAGGEGTLIPAACGGNVRKNTDGAEGWLHKPVSDSTGSIVNLFPTEDQPTNCSYFKNNGKKLMDARSSGRHNGFREHIRPVQSLRCSEFPRNMYLACSIKGRKTCYKIPDACTRYD